MTPLYVFGPKHATLDQYAASLVFAEFLKEFGANAHAISLTEPSEYIQAVLKKFDLDPLPVKPEIGQEEGRAALIGHTDSQGLPINTILLNQEVQNLTVENPIHFLNVPYDSFGSELLDLYQGRNFTLSKNLGSLLLAGAIDATENYTTAVGGYYDKLYSENLAKAAGLDIDTLAKELEALK
ncbi:hypothetical protein D3X11_05135 [Streptococcus sp. X16XC17]|uniref:hypothetical protein n=1 Tax=unclassified Streptococcus TaxID=2608887 RepID=UPI00066FEECC|nr:MULTISPECIES: hypothetical protein [unclassified Streptococcus]TCD45614.1 hypothetical protein D3X11_05135 [Streptococcus sp. X16XC17]